MQSKTVTFVLAIATICIGTLASIQLAQDDLTSVFGAPPRQSGELLYRFAPDTVHTVTITDSTGEEAVFKKQGGIWVMHSPAHDRADYRDLQRIVFFSANLRVEDVMPRQDTSLEETGMRETEMYPGRYKVRLVDGQGQQLAEYRLGRRTAWHHLDESTSELSQTFFVRPNEKPQKDHIYVCSAPADIKPSVREILDRGFRRLRDHRPFLFDPANLARVTIRRRGNETVLSRPDKSSPWMITKPLAARTQPDKRAGLLKGLYELEAVRVHDRGAVLLPPRPPEGSYLEIELVSFDADGNPQAQPHRLSVEQPASDEADTVYGATDDRPSVVFELPFKPTRGAIALQELPLTVDQLRGRTLASLHIPTLRSITIAQSDRLEPVHIFLGQQSHTGKRRWMVEMGGEVAPANEIALASLLQAISRNEVIRYASDAARNLAAYGLAPAQKRVILRGGQDEQIDLRFGRSRDGSYYAMRDGSSTVAEISGETYTAIAAEPHDWRDTLLLPFSIVDLAVLKIERPVTPPLADPTLILNYNFLDESWGARQYGEDATPRLDTQHANRLLKLLEGLRVERWLGPVSPAAQRALQSPSFRLTAIFREVDEQGDRIGVRESSFELAPASQSAANRYFYGRLSGDSYYFILGIGTYRALTARLMDDY